MDEAAQFLARVITTRVSESLQKRLETEAARASRELGATITVSDLMRKYAEKGLQSDEKKRRRAA